MPFGKLMKRTDVARRFGLSLSTVRRMEGTALQPIVGARGVRYFVEEHVEAVFIRIRRTRGEATEPVPGPVAAEVLKLFKAGANAIDVVKEFRLAPELVEQLLADWQRLSTTVLLENRDVLQIHRALRGGAISDYASLLAAVAERKHGSTNYCVRCHAEPVLYCRGCAQSVGRNALKEDAAERLF